MKIVQAIDVSMFKRALQAGNALLIRSIFVFILHILEMLVNRVTTTQKNTGKPSRTQQNVRQDSSVKLIM